MRLKHVIAVLLLAVLFLNAPPLPASAYSFYASSTTPPKIAFPSQPTAVLYGANRNAYSYLSISNEGVISGSTSVRVGEAAVTVLGISRFHHSFVKVAYWNAAKQVTQELWVEASYMRPSRKSKSIQVRDTEGNPLADWPVRVLGGNGEEIARVYTDEQGTAWYTGMYLNLADAFSFADSIWNNQKLDSGTLISGADGATFVSECLTAGGFCVHAPYVSNGNAGSNPYNSLFATLTKTLGVPYTLKPSDGPIDVSLIAPGDVIMMRATGNTSAPYGRCAFVHAVDPETQEVLSYSHTPYLHEWISADDPTDRILCVIHTSRYAFRLEPEPVLTLPETLTVPAGIPVQLAAAVQPAGATEDVSWTAEPAGALVWEDGNLTAPEAGDAVITFTVGGVSASCQVHAVTPSRLPAGTVSLGEQALSGLPVAFLELPASLTDIADDAFEDCGAVLIVPEGSYAEEFVRNKGLAYLIIYMGTSEE